MDITRAITSFFSGIVGYAAAKQDRFRKALPWMRSSSENAIPPDQYPRLNADAWSLYRDNKYFRKAVRSIITKTIGETGLTPSSEAVLMTAEGEVPFTAFRLRAQQIWSEQSWGIDWTGLPGKGGVTQSDLEEMALRQCILSGDVLYTIRNISGREQRKRRIPAPVLVQLIDTRRLADDSVGGISSGNFFHRGIEFTAEMKRVRYWIYDTVPGVLGTIEQDFTPKPIPADELYHVYLKEDIDQQRGTNWMTSGINDGRDSSDLQYNFIKGTAMQACVVGGYTLGTGKKQFGQKGDKSEDPTDANGNTITRMSPGMWMNLGQDGKIQMYSPNLNLTGYEAFFQHILRGISGCLPGVKSSTVTGDYRGSSFSSERSADNDTWPEIERLQRWFSGVFNRPIYEEVITAAVADGRFDGIITMQEFVNNREACLRCKWQGPVARSINPVDDVQAAALRIKSGVSTPQIEAAKLGLRVEDILRSVKDFADQAEQAGLPEIYVNNVLGFDTQDLLSTKETADAAAGGSDVASK